PRRLWRLRRADPIGLDRLGVPAGFDASLLLENDDARDGGPRQRKRKPAPGGGGPGSQAESRLAQRGAKVDGARDPDRSAARDAEAGRRAKRVAPSPPD